jgi:hypothetical protein
MGWSVRNGYHFTGNQAQAFMAAELLAGRGQHLHAQADAQQWSARPGVGLDGFNQATLAQAAHAIGKGTHARQHQPVGLTDDLRVGTEDDFLGATDFQCALHAVEIADTVVDDDDALGH